MVGALFIRSYERSERIYTAMQARGYTGQLIHHYVRPMRNMEWAALFALAIAYATFSLTARLWMPHS
jgi:cobalt/nickel transport system permease protein